MPGAEILEHSGYCKAFAGRAAQIPEKGAMGKALGLGPPYGAPVVWIGNVLLR